LLLLLILVGCKAEERSSPMGEHAEEQGAIASSSMYNVGPLEFTEGIDVDFGEIMYAKEIAVDLPIRNAGTKALNLTKLKNLRPCCFHGDIDAIPSILEPGARGRVRLDIDNGVRAGLVRGSCEIGFPSEESLNANSVLISYSYRTIGNIPILRFNCVDLNLGSIDLSGAETQKNGQVILEVDRDRDELPPEVQAAIRQQRDVLTVSVGEPMASKARNGRELWAIPIDVALDAKKSGPATIRENLVCEVKDRTISLGISADVHDTVRFVPAREISLVRRGNQQFNDEIRVESIDNAIIRDVILSGEPSWLTASIEKISPTSYRLRFTLDGDLPSRKLNSDLQCMVVLAGGEERNVGLSIAAIDLL